ncbi:MAG: hypothetical protein LUD47_00430 [Clostridia bacterium]|nr:hypothetical protein [Clostridia bacterium]
MARVFARIKDLRDGTAKMPPEDRGWFRIYAKREDIEILLKSQNMRDNDESWNYYDHIFAGHESDYALFPNKTNPEYYGIYVGLAQLSLLDTIVRKIIKGKNRSSNFRKTLSALLSSPRTLKDQSSVNEFLDRLIIEYTPEYKISKRDLFETDVREINRYITPLNTTENDISEVQDFISELSRIC